MMKEEIRNAFIEMPLISSLVPENNIKFYKWTDETRVSYPFILIVPTSPPLSGTHANDAELTKILTYDIHVQASNPEDTREIMLVAHSVMKNMGFAQMPGGVDDYFDDVRKYVQVRRYRINTKLYDNEY